MEVLEQQTLGAVAEVDQETTLVALAVQALLFFATPAQFNISLVAQ